MTVDLQPDELEVLQAEHTGPEPTVRVCIGDQEAPLRVQILPRRQGATRTRTIGTTPVLLMSADDRRAQAILIAPAAFLFALSAASAQDPSMMAAWPPNVPYVLTAGSAIYAAAASATVAISVITEYWATGE